MKAEDRAFEHCCTNCKNNKLNCGMKLISQGRDCIACGNYIEGYEQAEKDLELTWEDMMVIHKCIKDAMNYHLYKMLEGTEGQKTVYQDVLKRFKDLRNGTTSK